MAPEILLGKGYGINADLWSLGVCMFEFMCGYVPFGEEDTDTFNIYQKIINQPLIFPDYFLGEENEEAC